MIQRRVQVLPDHIANKIAAGEVVQRPASVVKELLENALDAGARSVTVVIEEGGKKLIQVVDDGVGMDEADAVASFQRHATSKISSYEDLDAIMTYGFRGEALASIAAVSQISMKTRRDEDEVAVVVHMDGGADVSVSNEGRERGTTVTVKNLFYNVPARRKFLKTTTTEFRHVYDAVQRAVLSFPEMSFRFISDGDTIFQLQEGTFQERMLDIFGQRHMEHLLRVEETTDYISLSGFIGKPSFGQKTKANQFLFLNRRPIGNRNINHAVFSAYEHLLTKGSYPFFLLMIDIDPHRVDVNVHPSKMEAKFEDEQSIYRFVSTVIRKSLSTGDYVPAVSVTGGRDDLGSLGLKFTDRQHSNTRSGGIDLPTSEPGLSFRQTIPAVTGADLARRLLTATQEQPTQSHVVVDREETHASLIWQLHNKYILSQVKNGLLVVDQHVAHERILYERTLQRFENAIYSSQQLLFPETIQLTPGEYSLIQELLPYFELLGFGIRIFGKNTVIVDAVPPDVKVGSEKTILGELLAMYKEYQQHSPLEVRDNIAKSYSCKAAIKAGDPLTEQEMRNLIDQLFATQMPYVCPHGRPVVLKIPLDELDRRFGRT
ncbi:MAG TPA: DNA mismatch repair endonuclease MutL [Bacteroidota bacterium]